MLGRIHYNNTILTSTHKIIETYKISNGFYFIDELTTFTKKDYSLKTDTDTIKKEVYEIQNLKSLEVESKKIEIISVPIEKIDDTKSFTENAEFWKNNPIVLEKKKIEFNVCE